MTTITREQAQKIIEAADEVISALAGTNEDVNPDSDNMLRLWDDLNDRHAPPEVVRELARIVLASLDERERNQQYIKRRDQENEDIALTVGKLRVELEGKDRRITEVTMWIKRLSSSLKNAKPDSKLPDDAMIWLNNEGLTSIEDILR